MFVGNLAEFCCSLCGPTESRLKIYLDIFRAFFVRKFVTQETNSCQLRSADVPP